MRINKNDYIGLTSGQLTVVDVVRRPNQKQSDLMCKCQCGNVCYARPSHFLKGEYKSCGCLKGKRIAKFNTTHGGSRNPLYAEWRSIVSRCTDPSSFNYKDYGARGITVCKEWLDNPHAFYSWVDSVGGRPPHSTLDRINNNDGYSPENCRWATMAEQARNRRSNIMITYNGKTQCIADWSLETGIHEETIRARYHRNCSVDDIFHVGHLPNSGQFVKGHH